VLKLDLAVILVAFAAGAFWLEQGHQVVIDAPATDTVSAAAAACPENDNVPYSPTCIAFLTGATETGMRWRVTDRPASTPVPQ